MEQFVTHAGLVNRKQVSRQDRLQTVSPEGSGRYPDERRYCREKQEFRMHT